MAPAAKVYFTDIENSAQPGFLLIPREFSDIFTSAYTYGARIFSNSWGLIPESFFSCSYDCQLCTWAKSFSHYSKGDPITNTDCKKLFGIDTCCEIANTYNYQCQDIDTILWKNQDTIILFANGNSGAISSQKNIGTPATAKNVVSVGASITTNDEKVFANGYYDYYQKITQAKLPFQSPNECCACKNFKIVSLTSTSSSLEFRVVKELVSEKA